MCEDVGEIEKFKEVGGGQGEGYFTLKANGGICGGGMKPNVVARTGFTPFYLFEKKKGEKPRYILNPHPFIDGQIVDMCGIEGYSGLEPITCDPRIIYFFVFNFCQLDRKQEIKKFKIPTREEARQWCNEVGIPERPVPFDRVNFNSPTNTRLRRNFPWWFDRD